MLKSFFGKLLAGFLTIVLCLMLAVPKIFGISSYTVLTGSMEPTIPVGSLIYVKAVDPQTLIEGDVAVFYDGQSTIPVTHRVVENLTGEGQIITKGDANAQEDIAPIPYPNVVGKMLLQSMDAELFERVQQHRCSEGYNR